MKKWLYWLISLALVISVLSPACRPSVSIPLGDELTEEYIRSLPPLFLREEIKDVDFTVLRDVDYIVRNYSVFTSPAFGDTFGNTLKDQAYLMRAAKNTLFQGFLAMPQDRIPPWATLWVEQEINSKRYDYNVFNRIYQELIKDSSYSYLKDPSQKEKLLKVMIEGMIKALDDPFTFYYDRELWILSEKGSSTGSYRGMGISLGKNERGELEITGVFAGSAAGKAGLKPSDAILAVDEKSVLDSSVAQFTMYVKTRKDSVMNLIVRRKLTGQLERVRVVLEEIRLKDLLTGPGIDLPEGRGLSSENLPFYYPLRDREGLGHPEILYIKIKGFTVQMSQDLQYFLSSIDMAKFNGIIIDLRDNPGGRIDAILYSVDYFLPSNDLITTIRYAGGSKEELRYNQANFISEDLPIAVLVNDNSASGAELFPAALRDNGRAVIISKDETTAGKGSVNNHFTLRRGQYGSLYVSIGLWYTPSGEMIEKMDLDRDGYYEIGGLRPDIKVDWTDEDILENKRNPAYYDPTIFKAIEWLKENYPRKK